MQRGILMACWIGSAIHEISPRLIKNFNNFIVVEYGELALNYFEVFMTFQSDVDDR